MTNEELAVALLSIFKPFGPVTSIKASRDQRGRPFGFVEYSDAGAAASALAYGPCLTLDSRRLRVEPAKRQRKLCIKVRLGAEEPLEGALDGLRRMLQSRVRDEDFKLSLQEEWEGQLVAAVVKFEDPAKARQAAEGWREERPEWEMTWINMDRGVFGSNVRNSGLVQLVPGNDGALLGYSFASRFSPPPSPYLFEGPPSPAPLLSPRYTPSYEEADYSTPTTDTDSFSDDLNKLTLQPDLLEGWLGHTLFAGRLNGQLVTIPLLHNLFAPHGTIHYIRLYNRGAVGLDGVPLDAYAFIRFHDPDALVSAMIEHGRVWLGQAIKCEHARAAALAAVVGGPVGGSPFQMYYPGKSNWFRAKMTSPPPCE
jgi:hypothetical protein